MGVSLIGQGNRAQTMRYVLATVVVLLGGFIFFYGPPVVPKIKQEAIHDCNQMVDGDYRSFRLRWNTVTIGQISWPHWTCADAREPAEPPVNMGWWVGL